MIDNSHINEIRKDTRRDIARNILIVILLLILFRFLLLPLCPDFIINIWNGFFKYFINLLTYLQYENNC